MKVINFYGGAGIGKSTIAADIFSKLKRKGHKTELVGEYAKWLWYQIYSHIALGNRQGITGFEDEMRLGG